MNDGLTLEKMRVVERLESLETKFNDMSTDLKVYIASNESVVAGNNKVIRDVGENIAQLNTLMKGNGHIGYFGRVEVLEKEAKDLRDGLKQKIAMDLEDARKKTIERDRHVWEVRVAIAGFIGSCLLQWFLKVRP